MNTNRSFLDNLNAGRKRRSGTALDHISETLQEIERQLDRAYAARTARDAGMQPTDDAAAAPSTASDVSADAGAVPGQQDHPKLRELAERLRETPPAAEESAQAATAQMAADGLEADRADFHRSEPQSGRPMARSDVAYELERLSAEVSALGERRDERTLSLLRLDMEQLRTALDSLAREETVRLVGRRWEELAAGQGQFDESSVAPLAARIDEIAASVQRLPDSGALNSLEQKVRGLAEALDQFVDHSSRSRPDLHELIEERLDEISRAIAATLTAGAPKMDTQPFERIEARIASLSRQIEEVVEESQTAQLTERLDALARRVEDIGERIDLPGETIREMAAQIASISQKVDEVVGASDPDAIYREIERRFAGLSEIVARNHDEVVEHGERRFEALRSQMGELSQRVAGQATPGIAHDELLAAFEARFETLAAKLDAHTTAPADREASAAIEARLEDLATRLTESVGQFSALDPHIVRQLQEQVGQFAEHLARSGEGAGDLEDLGPRLARIERSLAENQESVIDAARRAAGEVLASLQAGAAAGGEGGVDLSAEIKALETLARKSDDRNARTFEAIHDTLLKIVEHLSGIETETEEGLRREPVKVAVGTPPSLDPADEDGEEFEAREDEDAFSGLDEELPTQGTATGAQKLSPAEAAAAAAVAALSDQPEQESAPAEKRSMLGGLTRAFSQRKERDQVAVARKEPSAPGVPAAAVEPALDVEFANEPLEPGSGAPDLNAIMRRVRDEGGQAGRPAEADAAKADFIAAARRAAQAAAAEAESMKRKKSGESRGANGRFSVSGLLRSRKKAALMAVATLAVVGGGIGAAKLLDPGAGRFVKVATAVHDDKAKSPATPVRSVDKPAAAPVKTAATPVADTASTKAAAVEDEKAAIAAKDANKLAARETMEPAPVMKAAAVTAPAEEAASEGAPMAMETLPVQAVSASPQPASMMDATTTGPAAVDTQRVKAEELPQSIGTTALRQAAIEGDPKALFTVAEHYASGNGINADAAAAARYYAEAAEKGFAPAQYRIGNDYEKGIGVDRDIAKARMWYTKAADQGNASAMHNLGVLYAMGAAGDADNEAAARWFAKAAEFGVKDSQFNLGILSAKGVGMKRDLTEAYKWFAIVAETGDKDAAAKRDEVARALDPKTLKSARAMSELWKPKPLDPAANTVDLPPEWTQDKTTTASIDMKKAVTNIQLILNKNGYSAGPADGMMGGKTKSAIVAFQKDNGLEATGEVDKALVQALLAHND